MHVGVRADGRKDRSLRALNYFNRYTLSIGILLAVVVLSPGPGASRGGAALHDFAHAPAFACVTLLFLSLFKRRGRGTLARQYVQAVALAVLLGLATEIVQRLTGGDSSWLDLKSDTIGAFAACGLFAGVDIRIARRALRASLVVAGSALLVVHSVQFARVGLAYVHRNQEFPVLFDAKDPRPDRFLRPTNSEIGYSSLPPDLAQSPGEVGLHVRLSNGPWPGIAFEEPYSDWSRHERLMVDIANPGDATIDLVLRVHDRAHDWKFDDRFNRNLRILPHTRTTFAIPLADIERAPATRRLDLRAIADVRLFAGEIRPDRSVFVSRVWLE